jgi:hypothetical protein
VGARVVIGPQTEILGRARVVGADVVFGGASQGGLEIFGDTVRIEGNVAGDVRVTARHVTVGETAVVGGNIRFETLDDPVIEEGAQITGRQTVTLPQPRKAERGTFLAGIGALILFATGAGFLLGLVLLVVARGFVERSIDAMREAPLRSALVGLAVLFLTPLLAAAIMATVIGIPIGLLSLLAFPLLLFVGSVLAAFGLSDLIFNRTRYPGPSAGDYSTYWRAS